VYVFTPLSTVTHVMGPSLQGKAFKQSVTSTVREVLYNPTEEHLKGEGKYRITV